MPQALFKSNIGTPVIDEVAGMIRGCRIATLNAMSNSADGEGRGLVMDSQAITALLNLAKLQGDKIPAYFTHAWFSSEDDGLQHDTGLWVNSRIEDGNLLADFQAFDTKYKSGIFSRAKADPNSIAISPIFHYALRAGSEKFCDPTEFVSADFVKSGAINRAIFSETKTQPENKPTMDKEALMALLADDEVKASLKALMSEGEEKKEESNEDYAALEEEAGVTDEDKKKEDDEMPALMRASVRINRALSRQVKSLALNESALLAKAKLQAEASATALLGKGKIPGVSNGQNEVNAVAKFSAIVDDIAKTEKVSIGKARLIASSRHPQEYNATFAA